MPIMNNADIPREVMLNILVTNALVKFAWNTVFEVFFQKHLKAAAKAW